jgi:hypothetical protein
MRRVRPKAYIVWRPKRRAAPLGAAFETRVRAAPAAVPSRELPTFNGLYPSIVTRQLSQ